MLVTNHDVSPKPYDAFLVMVQGKYDYTLEAFCIYSKEYGRMMVIGSEEGAIYVTREQAKAFFGLVEPNEK